MRGTNGTGGAGAHRLPLGGRMVGTQEPLPFGLVCPHHGGPEPVARQPSLRPGQPSGAAAPAAALTGRPLAAQTGVPRG